MKNTSTIFRALNALGLLFALGVSAQNPIITDQYSADPSARVFNNNKVYLFPSHDIPPYTNKNKENWFSMEDYHVFSSDNLTDWTDHGVIVTQNKVPWVKPDSYSMWAPDCIERNGKYYFYFPSTANDIAGSGFTVGVAIADKPEGPYQVLPQPIKNVRGIDPNVFIDKDGQAYLYWSQGNIYAAKLKDNMVDLATEPVILQQLPEKGLKEGPYMFERNGIYYLTYPHVNDKIERLEYAIGNNPLGPFKVTGVIMDEAANGCWTNHHSVIQFKQQWYLFYHQNDLSPKFDKNRSVRIDSLAFNDDGTIKKVIPTLRGVGSTPAKTKIQVDRYSSLSKTGALIDFLNPEDTFKGWKTVLSAPKAYVSYNDVDFGKEKLKKVLLQSKAQNGGTLEIRADKVDGPLIAKIKIAPGAQWNTTEASLEKHLPGKHNVYIISGQANPIEIDWITFK